MNAWAVVVAGGRGTRFGKPYNKVFFPIGGRSILSRCLDAMSKGGLYEGIVLVLGSQDRADYEELTAREGTCHLIRAVTCGGATRQESVYNGLLCVPDSVDFVAIHDAARPYVSPALQKAVLEGAAQWKACVPGRPLTDTVKQTDGAFALSTPDRKTLCAVQTPQVFLRQEILSAHEQAREEGFLGTDDASLYERYFGKVYVVQMPDCEQNIKVTTPADVAAPSPFRIGTGFDAHRLAEGRELWLGGVKIPYEKGLLGHSDADAPLHALTDALLGAAAMGDIGKLFPDSDPAYKGISSILLLEEVRKRLTGAGFTVGNVDVTIVCQAPKLAPYIPKMRETIAKALEISVDQVSVKATTTERMGYEGRSEGISAQAVALVFQ